MKFIPQMEPWFGEEEQIAVNEYLGQGGWVTEFKETEKFEHKLAEYTNSKHCIVVNNGTISLTLAALACGIKPGDEIIIPNYTMIASPNSIKLIGAQPIFVDVEKDTLCLDINLVKNAITSKTRAIMLVNANGRYPSSGIAAFQDMCNKHKLLLIEDSAQALGCSYPSGQHMGTVGSVGSFSFSAPKVISTGQGGALITNDDEINNKLRKLKDFGRSGGGNDIHDSVGYNFKFTDIQAVIGLEQMKKLEWRLTRKKEILQRYRDNLRGISQVVFFEQDLENTSPWFIDVIVEKRTGLIQHLNANNIGSRIMYPPINKQLAYNLPGEYSVSNMIGKKGLWLPSASQLSNQDIDHVCSVIIDYFNS